MRTPPAPIPLHSSADPRAAWEAAGTWMTSGSGSGTLGPLPATTTCTPAPFGVESTGLGTSAAVGALGDEDARERRRQQRIAERRSFVMLKGCFIDAATQVPGTVGDAIRRRVRATHEPIDLWHLHEVLIALLPEAASGHAERIRIGMDRVFGPALAGVPVRPT